PKWSSSGDSGIAGRPVGKEWLNVPARIQCKLAGQCKLAVEPLNRGKAGKIWWSFTGFKYNRSQAVRKR
ncbi:MAG: hypothetical protein ACK55Z_36005, partial [bacterium]